MEQSDISLLAELTPADLHWFARKTMQSQAAGVNSVCQLAFIVFRKFGPH